MKKLSLKELHDLQFQTFKMIDNICRNNHITYYLSGGTMLGAARHNGFLPEDDDMDIAMMREDYDKFVEICKTQLDDNHFLQNYHTDIDFSPALSRVCIKGTYVKNDAIKHLRCSKNTYVDVFPLDNVPDDDELVGEHAKQLEKIDRLIGLKLFAVFNDGVFPYKRCIKKTISLLLAVIPLGYLQKKREQVMTKYSNCQTKRVCSTVSKYGYKNQIMDRRVYGSPVLIKFEDGEFFAPENYKEYLKQTYGDYMKIPPKEERRKPVDVYVL